MGMRISADRDHRVPELVGHYRPSAYARAIVTNDVLQGVDLRCDAPRFFDTDAFPTLRSVRNVKIFEILRFP